MIDLSGKSAVVTGSSRGIGAAIAKELAAKGANVVINHSSKNSRSKAEEVAESIADLTDPGKVIIKQADVSKLKEAQDLINSCLHEFESIDILVNNAGINRDTLLLRMKEEDWQAPIAVNLGGTFNCCKASLRTMMKQRWGRIINLSSIIGMIGNAGQTNYAASKAGIIGFSKSLAREVAARNITVNAVAPGFITTAMTEEMPEKVKEKLLEKVPLSRAGMPEEVANAVLFLASEKASYITGETIKIAGGMGM